MSGFFDVLVAALAEREPFALGIISGIKDRVPRRKGEALFFADGRIHGTLGGVALKRRLRSSQTSALNEATATFELVLDHDFGWDDGLICGGKSAG